MGSLNQVLGNNLSVVIVILLILIGITFIWIVRTSKRLKKYQNLFQGNEGKNIEGLLLDLIERINQNELQTQKMGDELTIINQKVGSSFQKWSLIRFKAFENTGGDQSFAFALLDEGGSGVVVSSIFGREESRVYCKSVQAGISNYPLSHEEKDAIQKALGLEKK